MGHFNYANLPAIGLGNRDPRRPYVTGGIGGGIPVFITCIGDRRYPLKGLYRDSVTGERYAIYGVRRMPAAALERLELIGTRMPVRGLVRLAPEGDRIASYFSRALASGDRVPAAQGLSRAKTSGTRIPPENDVDC